MFFTVVKWRSSSSYVKQKINILFLIVVIRQNDLLKTKLLWNSFVLIPG